MTKAKDATKHEQALVLGQLGAGTSVEFLPSVKWKAVQLPKWARSSDRFVLAEVCGDSLNGAGIYNGDLALVHLTTDIRAGDLVAALTPVGMLVKFLHYEDGLISLKSANPHYPPHTYEPSAVNIQGKVIKTSHPS
jgi:SOS-response transcriptional repressor LexA